MIEGEPTLEELLDDPIVQLLGASDGVSVDALRQLIARARRKLKDREPQPREGDLRLRASGA